jgi:hypothetical protein
MQSAGIERILSRDTLVRRQATGAWPEQRGSRGKVHTLPHTPTPESSEVCVAPGSYTYALGWVYTQCNQ